MTSDLHSLTAPASVPHANQLGAARLRHGDPILVRHLAELVEPIVDFIHQERPATILANDRGARLAGLAIFSAYRARYKEIFPTVDGKLHFAYLSKEQSDTADFAQRLRRIVANKTEGRALTTLFVDDWINTGATANRFVGISQQVGVDIGEVAVATLCGHQLTNVRHIVGSEIISSNSEWNAYEEITGVEIRHPEQARSYAAPNSDALATRQRIYADTLSRYQQAS